jgi:hypothetical protein
MVYAMIIRRPGALAFVLVEVMSLHCQTFRKSLDHWLQSGPVK